MPICMDCKKEVVRDYQTIKTKRGSNLCICDGCLKQYRRENARDSKQSTQQH